VKSRIVIAISVGIIISALFAALEMQMPNRFLEYLQLPGLLTIILVWGHGGVVPDLVSEVVTIGINAVVYSLIAFGVIERFGHTKMASHHPKDERSNQKDLSP
jgi:hypothetical protein